MIFVLGHDVTSQRHCMVKNHRETKPGILRLFGSRNLNSGIVREPQKSIKTNFFLTILSDSHGHGKFQGDTYITTYQNHGGSKSGNRRWIIECLDGEAAVGLQ